MGRRKRDPEQALEEQVDEVEQRTATPSNPVEEDSVVDYSDKVYLTIEDLELVRENEPIWRRLRIVLIVLFCVLWAGLVLGVVLTVVLSDRCPPRPTLSFWQSKVAYYLDPFAFSDSGSDWIGDLQGLRSSMGYLQETLGAGFVIMNSIMKGQYRVDRKSLGEVTDFKSVDPALGTMNDFRHMLKAFHKSGLEVVIALDFNGISQDHPWINDTTHLKEYDESLHWVSRNGKPPFMEHDGKKYYSVDNKLFDLQFGNEKILEMIIDVVKFWLQEGVDGILLKNCAFYVESDQPTSSAARNIENPWLAELPTAQLFQNGSVTVVQRVRKVLDDYSASKGREKVLIADPGDTGFGAQQLSTMIGSFLGTNKEPGAHLVVSRQFVTNSGSKEASMNTGQSSAHLVAYYNSSDEKTKSLALPTATDSDLIHNDLFLLVAVFLFPGTPVVYYGSELGNHYKITSDSPKEVYPMGKVPNTEQPPTESTLACQLPMPWSWSGDKFSAKGDDPDRFTRFLDSYGLTETMESVTAAARGSSYFSVVKKLVELRQSPSMLWGNLEVIQTNEKSSGESFVAWTNSLGTVQKTPRTYTRRYKRELNYQPT
ncbi:unnamed protein product [Dicrocoelium dendriticum]|nr:unnamed protein product [Dicrocoelium dendriticum]